MTEDLVIFVLALGIALVAGRELLRSDF